MRDMTIDAAIGRRERKKQATREALIDAAFTLFISKGFSATTVEEIADAVDVSSRTFFRYFASKEDVVLTFQEEQQAMLLERFRARPASEPVVTALKHAAVEVAQACEQGILFNPERFTALLSMMESSPALMASSLEHQQKKMQAIAEAIGERMGGDATTDLRPRVVAAIAGCGIRAASDCWQQDTEAISFSESIEMAFVLLEEGVNYPSATP